MASLARFFPSRMKLLFIILFLYFRFFLFRSFFPKKKKKEKKQNNKSSPHFFHEIPSLNDVILLLWLTFTVIPTRKNCLSPPKKKTYFPYIQKSFAKKVNLIKSYSHEMKIKTSRRSKNLPAL